MGVTSTLIHGVLGDGARSTKYDVAFQFSNPSAFPSSKDVAVLVKTTQFPAMQHQIIDLKFKGRSIPIRGQGKYTQTWECTFYLPENHSVKRGFEAWVAALDEVLYYNQTPPGVENATRIRHNMDGYTTNIALYQLNFNETKELVKYTLFNVFPIEIQPITVQSEGPGAIEEVTVTFAYSHFTMESSQTNSGSFIESATSAVDTVHEAIMKAGTDAINTLGNSINGFNSSLPSNSEFRSSQNEESLSNFADAANDDFLRKLSFGYNQTYNIPSFTSTGIDAIIGGITNAVNGITGDLVNSVKDKI